MRWRLVLSSKGSPMPPWLAGRATLNLWLSPGATSSAPHCGESHNILTVLRGRKTVVLLPPSSGADLGALPAWSASPHHCQCSSEEAATRHDDCSHCNCWVGEALLIPAGWYHAVSSVAGTAACGAGGPLFSCAALNRRSPWKRPAKIRVLKSRSSRGAR